MRLYNMTLYILKYALKMKKSTKNVIKKGFISYKYLKKWNLNIIIN